MFHALLNTMIDHGARLCLDVNKSDDSETMTFEIPIRIY